LVESSKIHPLCRREAPINLKPPFPLTGGGENIENMGSLRSGDGFGGLWRVVVNPRKPLPIRYYGGSNRDMKLSGATEVLPVRVHASVGRERKGSGDPDAGLASAGAAIPIPILWGKTPHRESRSPQ